MIAADVSVCLWFATEAEAAATLYTSLLPDSGITRVVDYPIETPGGGPGGTMMVEFTLAGRPFMALNGGPGGPHGPGMSMVAQCRDQAELDRVWDTLLADGGQPQRCGWLTDRFGIAWQVVPAGIGELVGHPDRARAGRVMAAVMTMVKLDLACLRAAADRG